MAGCDMCGKEDVGFRAIIEGVELTVCERCSKFGKVLQAPKAEQKKRVFVPEHAPRPKKLEEELLEFVVDDASSKIRQKREQLRMTQKEFAKLVSEKESLIHHIEANASHISLKLAKRLEKILHIQLVERAKEAMVQKGGKAEAFTLGDFIRINK